MGKRLLYPYGIVVAIILLDSYQRLAALMPPHFYDSIPDYGGNLLGETVWLGGVRREALYPGAQTGPPTANGCSASPKDCGSIFCSTANCWPN